MSHPAPPDRTLINELAGQAVLLARSWADQAASEPVPPAAKLLSRVLKDPRGLDFTVRFVDDVIRPRDLQVAARSLARLGSAPLPFLPAALRAAVKAGGGTAKLAPTFAVNSARRTFRALVGDLVVDATEKSLARALAKLRATGNRLNVNLLGEAVLGDAEADKRLKANLQLLERADVDYISLKVSAITGPHNPWDFDHVAAAAIESFRPFYLRAAELGKFVNLDMEDYRDLDLTIKVFTSLLDLPELRNYEAGIVLQAYQPDALAAMRHLQEWAAARVRGGGAPIKVRLVKGANLAMERVDAELRGWPLTNWPSKLDTDAHYKHVLAWAATPERAANVRLGVAGQNLFDIAFAHLLARARGVEDRVEFEMLAGMAEGQAAVIRRDIGPLLLYVPVVHPEEFDVAIAYLVRRLEENAMSANFMSAIFDLATDPAIFTRERDRFLSAVARSLEMGMLDDDAAPPLPNRRQDRGAEVVADFMASAVSPDIAGSPASSQAGAASQEAGGASFAFRLTADSDPSLPQNRHWARQIAAEVGRQAYSAGAHPGRGSEQVVSRETFPGATPLATEAGVNQLVERLKKAGTSWGEWPAAERAAVLRSVAAHLAAGRTRLCEVAAVETGKTLDQSDVEVSEAIDFANYYAAAALELERVPGARFEPARVTVVAPPWNFPLAIPAGGVLAALAAGSAVVLKPATPARRCGALLAELMWEAGVPREVLKLVVLPDRELSKALVAHEGVDRVVLTGSYETARLFKSWRPDMGLLAETSGKNALIVTPSADPDLAVRDAVASAFGHAGQKCSAASLVIMVGSVARSARFRDQLVDAVRSLRVGWPEHLDSEMGPLVVPDDAKALAGLTELGPGERWVLRPQQLDETGALWSPGVRAGVAEGSEYHLTEYFAPIMGLMVAEDLAHAIRLVNAVDYGLTSGIHSLDPEEIAQWIAGIEAGNLYVNRMITGAIVERQPFGGWKRSAIGNGTKAGGPSYLMAFGTWRPAAGTPTAADEPTTEDVPVAERTLLLAARSAVGEEGYRFLLGAGASDSEAWDNRYGRCHDPAGLKVERNVLRYLPLPVTIRAAEGSELVDVVRVVAAGLLAGAPLKLSTAVELSTALLAVLREAGVAISQETDDEWHATLNAWAASSPLDGRLRLVAPRCEERRCALARETCMAAGGSPDIALWAGPVTGSGLVELLPFIREQAISATAHRFGTPLDLTPTYLRSE